MIRGSKAIVSDEELEWLAECYIQLNKNKTYQNLSRTFKDYIQDFLDTELLALKRMRCKNGRQE